MCPSLAIFWFRRRHALSMMPAQQRSHTQKSREKLKGSVWGLALQPHRCCRLLCVEHVEEHSKPVLYLVSLQQCSGVVCSCCGMAGQTA